MFTAFDSEIQADGLPYDILYSTIAADAKSQPEHQLNIYYAGQIGKENLPGMQTITAIHTRNIPLIWRIVRTMKTVLSLLITGWKINLLPPKFHTLIPYGEEVSLWEENIPIPTGMMIM